MRVLGVDLGGKRIGLALSDDTATLARPWRTIAAGATPGASAQTLAELVAAGRKRDDDEFVGIGAVVVGLPRRLSGEDTDQSRATREFASALSDLMALDVHLQDERLTSVEAESRLALREKDWRRRKEKLDAASAAIILQDYLDAIEKAPR
jgi:putative Holliday junction resolvase